MDTSAKSSIRLKVGYRTPEALLAEYTRSVFRGSVALTAGRTLPVGTQFVFEMSAHGIPDPVEVTGEIIQARRGISADRHLLTVRYEPGSNRAGLSALLQSIFDSHEREKVRAHPRIPLQVRATEELPYSPSYLIRDISRGGLGLELEAPEIPERVKTGAPFLLELSMSAGPLALYGEVTWVAPQRKEQSKWVNPSFGMRFGKLRADSDALLKRILLLEPLPPPQWKARVSFGRDAVARMP
jgi:hypothetical protein